MENTKIAEDISKKELIVPLERLPTGYLQQKRAGIQQKNTACRQKIPTRYIDSKRKPVLSFYKSKSDAMATNKSQYTNRPGLCPTSENKNTSRLKTEEGHRWDAQPQPRKQLSYYELSRSEYAQSHVTRSYTASEQYETKYYSEVRNSSIKWPKALLPVSVTSKEETNQDHQYYRDSEEANAQFNRVYNIDHEYNRKDSYNNNNYVNQDDKADKIAFVTAIDLSTKKADIIAQKQNQATRDVGINQSHQRITIGGEPALVTVPDSNPDRRIMDVKDYKTDYQIDSQVNQQSNPSSHRQRPSESRDPLTLIGKSRGSCDIDTNKVQNEVNTTNLEKQYKPSGKQEKSLETLSDDQTIHDTNVTKQTSPLNVHYNQCQELRNTDSFTKVQEKFHTTGDPGQNKYLQVNHSVFDIQISTSNNTPKNGKNTPPVTQHDNIPPVIYDNEEDKVQYKARQSENCVKDVVRRQDPVEHQQNHDYSEDLSQAKTSKNASFTNDANLVSSVIVPSSDVTSDIQEGIKSDAKILKHVYDGLPDLVSEDLMFNLEQRYKKKENFNIYKMDDRKSHVGADDINKDANWLSGSKEAAVESGSLEMPVLHPVEHIPALYTENSDINGDNFTQIDVKDTSRCSKDIQEDVDNLLPGVYSLNSSEVQDLIESNPMSENFRRLGKPVMDVTLMSKESETPEEAPPLVIESVRSCSVSYFHNQDDDVTGGKGERDTNHGHLNSPSSQLTSELFEDEQINKMRDMEYPLRFNNKEDNSTLSDQLQDTLITPDDDLIKDTYNMAYTDLPFPEQYADYNSEVISGFGELPDEPPELLNTSADKNDPNISDDNRNIDVETKSDCEKTGDNSDKDMTTDLNSVVSRLRSRVGKIPQNYEDSYLDSYPTTPEYSPQNLSSDSQDSDFSSKKTPLKKRKVKKVVPQKTKRKFCSKQQTQRTRKPFKSRLIKSRKPTSRLDKIKSQFFKSRGRKQAPIIKTFNLRKRAKVPEVDKELVLPRLCRPLKKRDRFRPVSKLLNSNHEPEKKPVTRENCNKVPDVEPIVIKDSDTTAEEAGRRTETATRGSEEPADAAETRLEPEEEKTPKQIPKKRKRSDSCKLFIYKCSITVRLIYPKLVLG